VSKLWSRLLKENVIPPQEDEEVGVMGLERRGDKGCELCARVMPLTRHHLRPRTLHKKLLKQVSEGKRGDLLTVLQRWYE